MHKQLLIIWVIILWCLGLKAQQDTLTLDQIEVRSSTIRNQDIGSISNQWTTTTINTLAQQSLPNLLASQTGTYIKNYGPGGLATSSIRGGSASHTILLWNGMPIQSPMLGQLDLV